MTEHATNESEIGTVNPATARTPAETSMEALIHLDRVTKTYPGTAVPAILAESGGGVAVPPDDPEAFVDAVDKAWIGGVPATFIFDRRGKPLLMASMLLLGLLMTVDAAFYWLRGAPLLPIGWPGG